MKRLATLWISLLIAALPALAPGWMIHRMAVNVPFYDQWDPMFSDQAILLQRHQLSFADLYAQHNEHRVLIPRLIMLALDYHQWNTVREMLAGWAIAGATSLGLLLQLRRIDLPGRMREGTVFLWLLCNILIFSVQQWENWLWGMGIQNFLPMAVMVWAVYVASSRMWMWARVLAAIILCALAMFSSGNGILAWGLVPVVLFFFESRAQLWRRKWAILFWLVVIAIAVAAYFVGYQKPNPQEPYQFDAALMLIYWIAFLGNIAQNSMTNSPLVNSEVCGLAMLLAFIASAWYVANSMRRGAELARGAIPWLAIGGFSILTGVVASFARSIQGPEQALSSRYVTSSIFLPISLVVLIPIVCRDLALRRKAAAVESLPAEAHRLILSDHIPAFLSAALLFVVLAGAGSALAVADSVEITHRQAKAAMLLMRIMPANQQLAVLYPVSPKDIPKSRVSLEAPRLSRLGYIQPPLITSDDARAIQGADTLPRGARGEINHYVYDEASLTISGWAIDPEKSAPADAVFLTYTDDDGKPVIFYQATVGSWRLDQVAQKDNSGYEHCGFTAEIPYSAFPKGITSTTLCAWAMNIETGKAYPLVGDRHIYISPMAMR